MDTTTTTTPIEISAEELAKLWGFSVHAAYVEWVAQEAALEAQFVAMFADPHPPEGEGAEADAARLAYDLHQAEMCKLWDESTCECSPPPL